MNEEKIGDENYSVDKKEEDVDLNVKEKHEHEVLKIEKKVQDESKEKGIDKIKDNLLNMKNWVVLIGIKGYLDNEVVQGKSRISIIVEMNILKPVDSIGDNIKNFINDNLRDIDDIQKVEVFIY